jgi:hypothetical protein
VLGTHIEKCEKNSGIVAFNCPSSVRILLELTVEPEIIVEKADVLATKVVTMRIS